MGLGHSVIIPQNKSNERNIIFLFKSLTYTGLLFLTLLITLTQVKQLYAQEEVLNEDRIQSYPPQVHDSLYYELFKKYRSEDLKRAKQYAIKSYLLSKANVHLVLESKSIYALAYSYRELTDFDSAHYFYHIGINHSILYRMNDRLIHFTNNIGSLFERQDMYDSALVYYMKSLKAATDQKLVYDQAIALNNIGLIFYRLENPSEALAYFEKAIALKKNEGITDGIAINLLNYALCKNDLGDFETAKKTARELITVCLNAGNCDNSILAEAHFQLAYGYELTENFDLATKEYISCLNYLKDSQNLLPYSASLFHLAEIYSKTDLEKSLEYLKKSEEAANKYQLKRVLRDIYELYSEYYYAKGDLAKSLDYKNRFIVLKDSIFNEKLANNLRQLQLSNLKKESDEVIQRQQNKIVKSSQLSFLFSTVAVLSVSIAILLFVLYRTNRSMKNKLKEEVHQRTKELVESRDKLKITNYQLKKSQEEYDHLIYRTSHDLRGPLTTLVGLTNLARLEHDQNPVSYLDYLNRIEVTATGLAQVLSKLVYVSEAKTRPVEIEPVVIWKLTEELLKKEFYTSKKHVRVINNVPKDLILLSDGFLLRMALDFIIDNAFRYVAPDVDDCYVEVKGSINSNNKIEIEVIDNGIGISPELLQTIFELFSVGEVRHGAGVGLYVAKQCLEKLGGSIEVVLLQKPTIIKLQLSGTEFYTEHQESPQPVLV